jgi:hypothetical protein
LNKENFSECGKQHKLLRVFQGMETKQDFHEALERYRALVAETTDPVGLLLLKDIIAEMEDVERRWNEVHAQERHSTPLSPALAKQRFERSSAISNVHPQL